ncbi:uncharacterized protein LOC113567343 [Drosophila persimilis]|uniref:uncharacterized protein LOC113567343 n=1 Tax=Drosophila persimilis TaxID=7234 RepID=UPI000F098C36|nr:uncharacterized protein LOC113567343 [Drosophila persimilis]
MKTYLSARHVARCSSQENSEQRRTRNRSSRGAVAGQSSMLGAPVATKQRDNLAGTLAAGDPICHASSPHRGPVTLIGPGLDPARTGPARLLLLRLVYGQRASS